MGSVPQVRFGDYLAKCNGLHELGFQRWVFRTGMLFGATAKWWGRGGDRERRHEGLDLWLYSGRAGQVHNLDERTEIPAMFDGEVVKIERDFLGQSVFLKHSVTDGKDKVLCTVYGHVRLLDGVREGAMLRDREVFATIAAGGASRSRVPPPHLHISAAWVSESFSLGRLNWSVMNDCDIVKLLDPLGFLGEEYEVVDWVPEVTR